MKLILTIFPVFCVFLWSVKTLEFPVKAEKFGKGRTERIGIEIKSIKSFKEEMLTCQTSEDN